MTIRLAGGTGKKISGRALLGSAALGGLMLGLLGPQSLAYAEIGLAPGGRGSAYITFQGGYQHRNGAAAVAPAGANNTNPFGGGLDVEVQAIATPDLVSTKAGVAEPDRTAASSASATPDSIATEASAQQIIGGTQGQADGRGSANGDSAKSQNSARLAAGDMLAEGGGSASASRGAMAEADSSALAQDSTDQATANATAQGVAGSPSTAQSTSDAQVNAVQQSDTDSDANNPASAATDELVLVNLETLAGAEGEAMANSPPNSALVDTTTAATLSSGISTAGSGAEAEDNSSEAQAFIGTFIDTDSSSSATVSNNTANGRLSSTTSGNTIDGKTALAQGTGITVPEGLLATAIAELRPGESVEATVLYDRQAQAPFVGFESNDTPIVFNLANENLEADDGAFGGFSFGYVFVGPVMGLIDRFEAYGTHSRNEDDEIKQSQAFTGVSADGQALVSAINTRGLQIETDETLTQTEFGMRFKSDRLAQGVLPLIVSLEPFYMNYEQESGYGLAQVMMFESTVEADLWGGQVALESEIPIIAERLHWVGRVSGGVYWMDADGDFSNSLTGKTLGPGIEETGYRLGAETGLRLFLGEHAFLTATGAADHLSEAPRAVFRSGLGQRDEDGFRTAGSGSARIESDELTNYRANLRLTFTTRSHEPVAFK